MKRSATKAFLFDLDGVLIDSEPAWQIEEARLYPRLLGNDVTTKMGPTIGMGIDSIYDKATAAGAEITRQRFHDEFDKLGDKIYNKATIPDGLHDLVVTLRQLGFKIGIVSASPMKWIDAVINRLALRHDIDLIISIHERKDLAHKPAPDGYLDAIKSLGCTPDQTIILEDSNTGIAAAKAAGAYTIGLRQNLLPGYVQEGADIYADTLTDVAQLVKLHTSD